MANNIKKILVPYSTNFCKQRYGSNQDSGYVLLESPFNQTHIVYSYGVGDTENAISFDLHCSKLGKSVYLYDASIDSPAIMAENFIFKKEFLTPLNFKNHILENGHELENFMTLKMDIEGDEYACINENIDLIAKHFNQVTIECHNISQYENSSIQQDFFEKLLRHYKIVHIHGNNYDSVYNEIPNCLELTFLRNDYPVLEIEKNRFPDSSVDFPNNPNLPDIVLDWWLNPNSTKVYIEAGANDGVFQSRSINLSNDKNYKGILIEPCKHLFEQCKKNRENGRTSFYNCALVSLETESNNKVIDLFYSKYHSAMNNMFDWESSAQKEQVEAISLTTILEKEDIYFVDYLFLDVEGYELEVLKGIDFNKISFGEIEIESHHIFTKTSIEEELEKFKNLLDDQYQLKNIVADDGLEKFIFIKK